MRVDVVMPQMGESIAEGTITRWMKQVGDTVSRDEPIFEISTDKVDAEIPSPAAGRLVEIKSAAGETVPVNQVVAILETDASAAVSAESAGAGTAAPRGGSAPGSGAGATVGACGCPHPEDRNARACGPGAPALHAERARSCRPSYGRSRRSTASIRRPSRHGSRRPRHEEGHPGLRRQGRHAGGAAARADGAAPARPRRPPRHATAPAATPTVTFAREPGSSDSRCLRCARRSPSTWSSRGARRRTSTRSSKWT
jgi:2-oxoglutarate dehydrogenase E2 component (dihydrolipoamide succinyltransferase)